MFYKYHIENGTSMELSYECECADDIFSGVILPSNPRIRRTHGINPSFTMLTEGSVLKCFVRSTQHSDKPGKMFTLFGDRMNHVTLQCPQPFQDQCDPVRMIISGKWLPASL